MTNEDWISAVRISEKEFNDGMELAKGYVNSRLMSHPESITPHLIVHTLNMAMEKELVICVVATAFN